MPKENKDHLTLSTQELLTKANGSVDSETAKAFKNGQTVPSTQVNGTTTEPKDKVNSFILTEMCTKASG
jgi:hypothetical protein